MEALRTFEWPGNVRQLVNAARRLTVTAPGSVITAQDIPGDFGGIDSPAQGAKEWTRMLASWADRQLQNQGTPLVDSALPEFERALIELALSRTNGHRQEAAKLLGWGRNTLTRKMKALFRPIQTNVTWPGRPVNAPTRPAPAWPGSAGRHG
jgi:two-component system nitrogen regulation response regulator GlnG